MNRTLTRQISAVAALLLACSACSSGSSSTANSTKSRPSARTGSSTAAKVVKTARCVIDHVTTAVPPKGVDTAFGITQGPGGTWYGHGGTINRLHDDGTLDEFPIPDAATASAGWLTWDDASSAMWFSDRTNGQIGT